MPTRQSLRQIQLVLENLCRRFEIPGDGGGPQSPDRSAPPAARRPPKQGVAQIGVDRHGHDNTQQSQTQNQRDNRNFFHTKCAERL